MGDIRKKRGAKLVDFANSDEFYAQLITSRIASIPRWEFARCLMSEGCIVVDFDRMVREIDRLLGDKNKTVRILLSLDPISDGECRARITTSVLSSVLYFIYA